MDIDKILKDLNIEEAEIENWVQIPKEELDNIARKIEEVTEENERLKEENEEYKLRLCKTADFILPYRNGFNNWFEFLIEDKCKLLEILNGGKLENKGE